jgi:hypothetical protein
MTKEQLAALEAEIGSAVDTVANIGSSLAPPPISAYIVLGQAVAHLAPELINDVVAMFSKGTPTDADRADMAAKIAEWVNPSAI